MIIKQFSDKVLLKEKREVLKLHLYSKLLQYNVRPLENDIDIILELYLFGGYTNSEEQKKFIDLCIVKKLRKTDQSLRNTFSKYVTLGILDKPRNTVLSVNETFIPKVVCDKLVLQHLISHAD